MASVLQLRDDFCNVVICSGKALIFKQGSREFTMHAFKPLQMRSCGRGVAMPGRFNGLKNQVSYTRHGGDHHYDLVMLCRFANDGGALAEPLGISYGGAAKLHYDQPLSVHHDFSNFCNTAPIL